MRRVDRSGVTAPSVLTDPAKSGPKETEQAKEFYADGDDQDASFSFKVYTDQEIKDALTLLFHGKCAYCESRYESTQPMDVEHWRPKGAIELGKRTPRKRGYYWLAADWDNLLPSCADCNRRRYHCEPGSSEELLLGKAGQFPLLDEGKRATKPGEEVHESPLLLHPCNDDPEEHLVYPGEEEEKGIMRPRVDGTGAPSPRGVASIRVYALNRQELVNARREHYLDVEGRILTIRSLMEGLEDAQTEVRRQGIAASLEREARRLKELVAAKSPYSMLARHVIERHRTVLER